MWVNVGRWEETGTLRENGTNLTPERKIEEMSPLNKILQESIFGCLLAVKPGEDFREGPSGWNL